jgi:hypothetical protein
MEALKTMTHMRTTRGRKAFVKGVVRVSSPRRMYKVYRAVEKAIGYKHHKR